MPNTAGHFLSFPLIGHFHNSFRTSVLYTSLPQYYLHWTVGGFLTGHLLGQFPDSFRAAVLRNPVCNLSLMVGISDITDWCWVEAFGSEVCQG